jgi:copper chaperone
MTSGVDSLADNCQLTPSRSWKVNGSLPIDLPLDGRFRIFSRPEEREAGMITRTIEVDEIHCGGCENTIQSALSRLPGVAQVVASAERNDVRVSFDDNKVSEDQLRERLEEVGFAPVS